MTSFPARRRFTKPRQPLTEARSAVIGRDLLTADLPGGLADGRYFFTIIEQGTLIEGVLPPNASGEPVEPRDF